MLVNTGISAAGIYPMVVRQTGVPNGYGSGHSHPPPPLIRPVWGESGNEFCFPSSVMTHAACRWPNSVT